jgi:glycosyltransferase involved in cell wall biosynthesis
MRAEWENTAVVIPAYNAGKYLKQLVGQIAERTTLARIIIVNDCSTDTTAEIAAKLKVKLLTHKLNKGKGAALLTGFKEALQSGYAFAISIDADLQHDPDEISNFLKKQQEGEFDMVIGCREFKAGIMPFHRICSNRITSAIISLVCGKKIYDSQSGYRLYRLSWLDGFKFVSERYQFESEIIIKYARKGAEFGFIPIKTIYRGQESHISNFRDIINFLKLVLHEIFQKNGEKK